MTTKTALAFIALATFAATGCSTIGAMSSQSGASAPEKTGDPWFDAGQAALYARKIAPKPTGKAKNVILFIGDGMDINTVTAARIYSGQRRGEDGEANMLSFDRFPNVAFAKTYTTDYQVADSAGTATAMMTGDKTRSGVLGVNSSVARGNCPASLESPLTTLLERAEDAGLSTGVVSTAELTHATPASTYAHTPDRNWAVDSAMPKRARDAGCRDIARQFIEFDHGDGVEVALGGGRAHFTPADVTDAEYPERKGARADGRDLTAEWAAKSEDHVYVWNRADFNAANAEQKLLGLFEPGHMQFETDRPDDGAGEPSLAEMTRKAIEALSRNEKGFFLMVEGARIDHAHHAGNAYRALRDTEAYAEAVATARAMTDDAETLIVVTADHGHTLAIQGYPKKGADILGPVIVDGAGGEIVYRAQDGKPYTILAYANGPGSVFAQNTDLSNGRPTPADVENKNYRQQALVPTGSETHGGQDVPVYASGPNSQYVSGVMEQNVIYHIMADALGL